MTEETNNQAFTAHAMLMAELCLEGRKFLMEEHSSSFKWLMASLLALNGAGLIALKDMQPGLYCYLLLSGAFFFAGICCALLIAYVGQKSNQKMIAPMSRGVAYWRLVAATGERNEDMEKSIDNEIDAATKVGSWPSRFGFGSIVMFALGLAVIARGLVP